MEVWELEVRESVRQTLSDYTAATDRFDLPALARCFSTAGVLEFHGAERPFIGAGDIEAGLRAATSGPRDPERRSPTHVRHHVASVRFGAVASDRVEVDSYFAVYTDVGLDHWGRYRDVVVSQDGRWVFERRRILVDGFSDDSLMGG